jgi:hypothetical protein
MGEVFELKMEMDVMEEIGVLSGGESKSVTFSRFLFFFAGK